MLKVIISPAKKMKIRNDILPYKNIPFFIKEAEKLFSYMGNMSFDELKDLWKCSDKLVEENERQFRIGNLKQNLRLLKYCWSHIFILDSFIGKNRRA